MQRCSGCKLHLPKDQPLSLVVCSSLNLTSHKVDTGIHILKQGTEYCCFSFAVCMGMEVSLPVAP